MNDKAQRLRDRIRMNRERWAAEGFTAREDSPAVQFGAARGLTHSRPFNPERLFARVGNETKDKSTLTGLHVDYFMNTDGFPWALVVHGSIADATHALAYGRRHSLLCEEIRSWLPFASRAAFLSRHST